jgi:N-acyl homoserine lactone hydrolase
VIRIYALRCGTVGTDETVPDRARSENPYAYTGIFRGGKHRVWLPVYTYLIEHPRGNILVDTGWHTAVRSDPIKHMSWQLNIASKAVLPPGEAVTEQLALLGLAPSQLDFVLLTHLDVDHVSGLKLVKDAKKIYAGEAELKAASRLDMRYNRKLWEGIPIVPVPMAHTGIGPEGMSFDVFGDGSIQFVDLSGHSAGTTGVLITSGGRFVLLTADACYNRSNWEKLKLQGITTDKGKALRALEWVQKMSRQPGCAEILATHDPEIQPHMIKL